MLPQGTKKDAALTEVERQSAGPAGLPTLHLTRNGTTLRELSLTCPRLLIGRSEDNDISIPSSYVSRHHILLVRHGGSTILVDLNSTNGTFVNSKRVNNHVLADNDVITVDLHSMFVQYSIKYCSSQSTSHGTLDDIESADVVIEKALAEIGNLLESSDTDLLPALSEDVPTEVGFVDDR